MSRHDRGALRLPRHDGLVPPRELQRAFVRLGARVREEHALREATLRDRLGREDLLVVPVKIRHVHERVQLRGDPSVELGVTVPEPAHRDTRRHVEVAPPRDVPHLTSRALREHDRLLAIVLDEDLTRGGEEIRLRVSSHPLLCNSNCPASGRRHRATHTARAPPRVGPALSRIRSRSRAGTACSRMGSP